MNHRFRPFTLCALAGAALVFSLPLRATLQEAGPSPDDSADQLPVHDTGDKSSVFSNLVVPAGERVQGDTATVIGNTTIDGIVTHDSVSVVGNLTVNGTVGHNAVAVVGNLTINGRVHGDVVVVCGDLTLGPNAFVFGKVYCVGGELHRSPGAFVHGGIEGSDQGDIFITPFGAMGRHRPGRPWFFATPFGALNRHVPWIWGWPFSIIFLAVYVLIALVFPHAVRRCGDRFAQRPGVTILSGILGLLALPMLFILLLITVVGIPLAIFLPVGVFLLTIFGKSGLFSLIGRSLSGNRLHPAVDVLIAGALCAVISWIPIFGWAFSLVFALFGFGCALTGLFTPRNGFPASAPASPAPQPATEGSVGQVGDLAYKPGVASAEPPPIVPPASPPTGGPAVGTAAPVGQVGDLAHDPLSPQPVALSSTLPRAGFWIRMGALAFDLVLMLIFAHVWFIAIAIYAAIMWALKGATVGGLVFGLRVVRRDDRPMDWSTAIVRALGCYLSAVFAFLGFIWIAFDRDRQAWHDKIADTVVVRTKGVL